MKRIAIPLVIAVMTAFLIPQCYASVIINHTIVDSDNDCFQLITYVHKDEDSIPTEDFYAFQMRVHAKKCSDRVSQSIDLKFASLSPNLEITGFMFQIEGNNRISKR